MLKQVWRDFVGFVPTEKGLLADCRPLENAVVCLVPLWGRQDGKTQNSLEEKYVRHSMRCMAPCQIHRDNSEVIGRITQRRFRVCLGSWSHCYRQMLKITQRGKQSARRCAYLSSISLSVLFMHKHKHRTDPARLSENSRQKQQQWIYIAKPPTDWWGSALLFQIKETTLIYIHGM